MLAAVTYFPLFRALTHFANPALAQAQQQAPVVVVADPADCSVQFNPVGTSKFTSPCDVAKSALVGTRRALHEQDSPAGSAAPRSVWARRASTSFDATRMPRRCGRAAHGVRRVAQGGARPTAGYPAAADPARINTPMVVR